MTDEGRHCFCCFKIIIISTHLFYSSLTLLLLLSASSLCILHSDCLNFEHTHTHNRLIFCSLPFPSLSHSPSPFHPNNCDLPLSLSPPPLRTHTLTHILWMGECHNCYHHFITPPSPHHHHLLQHQHPHYYFLLLLLPRLVWTCLEATTSHCYQVFYGRRQHSSAHFVRNLPFHHPPSPKHTHTQTSSSSSAAILLSLRTECVRACKHTEQQRHKHHATSQLILFC